MKVVMPYILPSAKPVTVVYCTDRAPQTYSCVTSLYGLAKMATDTVNIMNVFFGEIHGKGEWDKEGGVFKQAYMRKCLGAIGVDSMKLPKIVEYLNKTISTPKSVGKTTFCFSRNCRNSSLYDSTRQPTACEINYRDSPILFFLGMWKQEMYICKKIFLL